MALIILGATLATIAQDSTWYKFHQIPGWESDKVFGGISIVEENSQRLIGTWLKSYTGGQTSRVAYYNFNGELTKQLDMMTIPLYYEELHSIIQFNPNQFLLSGQGANPWSNANVVGHNLMCDSLGQEIFFRWGDKALRSCSKSSDTTFLATEGNYLTHFNLHGDTLWQTTWQDLLQVPTLPAPFEYRVLTILYRDSIAEVWFQENNGNNQWLSRVNLNTGQVMEAKQYQLGKLEYLVQAWEGYFLVKWPQDEIGEVAFADQTLNEKWSKSYESSWMTNIYFGIVNRSNQVMYSVVHNEYDSTHICIDKHWYTRIYTVDSLGNEIATWQYFDKDYAITAIPRYEFENGGFLVGYGIYTQLANNSYSAFGRSNVDGQILNMPNPDRYNFFDVSIFDPYATEPLEVEETINSGSSISIYPNPTNSIITISVNDFEKTDVYIFDVFGKLIQTTAIKQLHTQLDFSGYTSGIYLIQINCNNSLSTFKIVKQ